MTWAFQDAVLAVKAGASDEIQGVVPGSTVSQLFRPDLHSLGTATSCLALVECGWSTEQVLLHQPAGRCLGIPLKGHLDHAWSVQFGSCTPGCSALLWCGLAGQTGVPGNLCKSTARVASVQITATVTRDLALVGLLPGRSGVIVSMKALSQCLYGLRAPEVAQICTSRLQAEEVGGKDHELGLTGSVCLQAHFGLWRWSTSTYRLPR